MSNKIEMIKVPQNLKDEVWDYCRLNNITNIDEFTLNMLKQGFAIEKYGTSPILPQIIEKEVIKEVEVEKIVEVPVEKIVEKIVEVPVQVEVLKEIFIKTPKIVFLYVGIAGALVGAAICYILR